VVPERPTNVLESLQQLAFSRVVRHREPHMIIIEAEGSTNPSSGEIGHEPYADVVQSECKVRDDVLNLIARLE
jgi:hypothetical protein